jgi:hypothetical protein
MPKCVRHDCPRDALPDRTICKRHARALVPVRVRDPQNWTLELTSTGPVIRALPVKSDRLWELEGDLRRAEQFAAQQHVRLSNIDDTSAMADVFAALRRVKELRKQLRAQQAKEAVNG